MLIVLSVAWFAVRWQLGELFADVTGVGSQDASAIADSAIALAPSSPRGYWLSGAVLKTSFDDVALASAVGRYEEAARRSPYYFRSWTELGRVNEQAGRNEQAESAFLRAIELAPEYTIPRWQAGNFYLRRGRLTEAVSQLNAAAMHSSPYRVQIFSTAWNVLGNDTRQVEQFLTESGDSKASLAYFYGSINRPDDAIRVWNMIEQEKRSEYGWQVNALARDLMTHRSYRGALEFSRQAGIDPDARPEVVSNGDFELPVKGADRELRFDWSLVRIDGKVDVSSDSSVTHGGRRSLRFSARGYAKAAYHLLRQAVAVTPGVKYRLSFWVRTEELRSGSLPFIEVRNAKNDLMLASSPAFDSGTNDWRQMSVEFAVPAESDGVYLISGREPCAEECPMTGIFWLDDFILSRSS